MSPSGPGPARPLIAISGPSNSGKTTLICRLLEYWRPTGRRLAVVKHSHKRINPDPPTKDTDKLRQAGADAVALAAPGVLAVTHTVSGDPPLDLVLASLPPHIDLIILEGYKTSAVPKLVLLPDPADLAVTAPYPQVRAYICDQPCPTPLPVFARHQIPEIAAFITKMVENWK